MTTTAEKIAAIERQAREAKAKLLADAGITKEDLAAELKIARAANKAGAAERKQDVAISKARKEADRVSAWHVGDKVNCGYLFGTMVQLRPDNFWEIKIVGGGVRFTANDNGTRVWKLVDPMVWDAAQNAGKVAEEFQNATWVARGAK